MANLVPALVLLAVMAALLAVAATRPGALNRRNLGAAAMGFLGWFVFHSVYWGAITLVGGEMGPAGIIFLFCLFIPLPVNVLVLALLSRRRPWLVLGAVTAFLLNAALMFPVVPAEDVDVVTPLFEILAMLPFYFRGLGF